MILDGQDNEMAWPEGPTHGHAEFTVWYEKVTRRFFDEVHTLKKVESTIDGATASVEVVVNWRASVWEPPSPNSKRRMSPLAVADLDVTAKVRAILTTITDMGRPPCLRWDGSLAPHPGVSGAHHDQIPAVLDHHGRPARVPSRLDPPTTGRPSRDNQGRGTSSGDTH